MNYTYPNDGKLHFRYHDLLKCTPGSIKRLIKERNGELTPFSSDDTGFGGDRHEMFEDEMKETNRLPEVFLSGCTQLPVGYKTMKIDMVEEEIITEIFPGIVFHSRPDAVSTSGGVIADPKVTVEDIKKWNSSRQLMMYVLHFMARNIPIYEICYLGEKWNYEEVPNNGRMKKVKKDIIDYQCLIKPVTRDEVIAIKNEWARPRLEYLIAAQELYKEGNL